ncbi:PTS system cellobiose-specific IIB component [Spiroplasma clarkii]|uniref:PTS system, cellobiose-specific IIB component n=1 Tax=Spiroplasma clarkii TaxID=2139 RepID=A0A1Y0L1S3_9MOLU|nr:PTS sugar transporter subunit IIB [Spiroplasma clarkii]ARU91678.1 PTS system cellobiose-specific IIB component [Spiroplasma clarkii]ATX71068.1 PTS system, cellobiose-specific IIB component [Spiroplasma clarkii]
MKKILLICSAGMSTSMLVKKMQMYASSKSLQVEIQAEGIAQAKQLIEKFDVILLGPQISYALDDVKKIANGKPVDVIPAQIYALAKGDEAIKLAYKISNDELK